MFYFTNISSKYLMMLKEIPGIYLPRNIDMEVKVRLILFDKPSSYIEPKIQSIERVHGYLK